MGRIVRLRLQPERLLVPQPLQPAHLRLPDLLLPQTLLHPAGSWPILQKGAAT